MFRKKQGRFKSPNGFHHGQSDKIGILLTNLGTPEAPTRKALKTYLAEFLSDPRVVEVPRLLWNVILHGVILNIRPQRSAKNYASIWTPEGSPLKIHTENLTKAVQKTLEDEAAASGNNAPIVTYAMRYGNPSVPDVIDQLLSQGVRKLVVIPLYPQYSASTTASTFDAVAKDFTHRRWLPELRFLTRYHDHPSYITACAEQIRKHWETKPKGEKLIFSFHGIPLRYFKNGDPYHCECHKTSRLIASELGLSKDEYLTTFQSRFGREPWLQPYTDKTLIELAASTQSVDVFCPGFSADCLETLEEIEEENRDYFLENGGQQFHYIPALNDSPHHVQAIVDLIHEQTTGWTLPDKEAIALRENLAKAMEEASPN